MFRHVAVFGLWLSATWPSHGLPRGTIVLGIGSKLYGVRGIRTPDLPQWSKPLQSPPCQRATHCSLFDICVVLYLNSCNVAYGGGSGRGLAPTRGRIALYI
jgi:hypothetical protein